MGLAMGACIVIIEIARIGDYFGPESEVASIEARLAAKLCLKAYIYIHIDIYSRCERLCISPPQMCCK